MAIPPIVLTVMMCDAVHRDRDTGKWYLMGAFNRLSFREFPTTVPAIQVFLGLIEDNGIFDLRLRIVDVNEEDEPIHELAGQLEGRDPLKLFDFPITLANVRFPEAGEYRLQVLVAGEVIAERKLAINQTS